MINLNLMLKQCTINAMGLSTWKEMTKDSTEKRLHIQTLPEEGFTIVSDSNILKSLTESCCITNAFDLK